MHPNAELITRFYTAFQRRDWAQMAACYHQDVRFSDPVFTDLRGERAAQMWRMLCERGKDLRIEFRDVTADDATGAAHWDADYTFSRSGRKVHNSIDARFRFRDGLIVEHDDHFNFWRWSSQALGPVGQLLGWTPFLQKRVQAQSMNTLAEYSAARDSA